MKFYMDLTLLEIAIWDNDGGEGGDGGDGGDGDGDGTGGTTATKTINERTFTQEEVDQIVVKRNKKERAQLETLEKNYEGLLQQRNLDSETREQLETDLENLRSQMRTKEQQLEHEKKQAQKKYETELKSASDQASHYKTLYETSTIKREIMDAAATNDAFDPDQFVTQLISKAKLVDELTDDGEKTGRQVTKIDWEIDIEDDDGKTRKQNIVLSPAEVINKMKEVKRYQNLFKSNVASGLGGGNAGPGKRGRVDVKSMSPAEYAEFRKTPEGKKALGLVR